MFIGNRRELFVDRFLIEKLNGTRLELQHPQTAGVAIRYDKPWEGKASGYPTIFQDGDIYRMYYRGYPRYRHVDREAQVTCYAESRDGIHWEKPDLGLFEVMETRDNNVILAGDGDASSNFSPFVDTKPGVPEAERYKAIGGTVRTGLMLFASSDGIHWRKEREQPILPPSPQGMRYDSHNLVFWSELEECYVCYFRVFADKMRTIARTTSPDLIAWEPEKNMGFGGVPIEQLYINQTIPYYLAPHIYIATPARFVQGQTVLSEEEAVSFGVDVEKEGERWKDTSETVLMSSRGGYEYDRTFMEGFVRPGLNRRNWVSRSNYMAWGIVPTGPAEMSMYIGRQNKQPDKYLERLALRIDGFASVNAPYSGGDMVTEPLEFDGKELHINYATGASGHVLVEIQEQSGRPIPGFTAADSEEIIGDEIDRTVRWKQGADVGAWAGKSVKLRFMMKDADLFSWRFS